MRERPAARLLVLDARQRLLLFKFDFKSGPLAGARFWATPGGAVDPGETFAAAASRVLFEETGLSLADLGPEVARRDAVFRSAEGDQIRADERYFLIRTDGLTLAKDGWTALEQDVMTEHRWWTIDEIRRSDEQIWPENLADLLEMVLTAQA
jgi:8-oxo-dGTP diphosphatase